MNQFEQAIKNILIQQGHLSEEFFKEYEALNKSNTLNLIDYLIKSELVSKSVLGVAISAILRVPYADMAAIPPDREIVLKLSINTAQTYNTILCQEFKDKVVFATSNPAQFKANEEINSIANGRQIQVLYTFPEDIRRFLKLYRSLDDRFNEIVSNPAEDMTVQLMEEILFEAFSRNSTDIHIEPQEKQVIVRCRVDGKLLIIGKLQKIHYETVINWLKVQAHIRIDEHYNTQDGSIKYITSYGRVANLRLSIIPLLNGEKVVLRVLAEYVGRLTLTDLGVSVHDQGIFEKVAKLPFGMILVTGPTGAGKTTTLYSMLKVINDPSINISTVEDPVEYRISGINHMQVNEQTGLTFMKGLRSLMRQDPDVILLGEIRDSETASVAVNAALTGHLLFSTFHANDAATAVPRLLDMGIEPFLLASTLKIIIAQRLVRKICKYCKHQIVVPVENLKDRVDDVNKYFKTDKAILYVGDGCKMCGGTGYSGRIGVYENILVSSTLAELMLKHPSKDELWAKAREEGARTFFEDGMEKVLAGQTTIEELIRVAPLEIKQKRVDFLDRQNEDKLEKEQVQQTQVNNSLVNAKEEQPNIPVPQTQQVALNQQTPSQNLNNMQI